MDFAHAARPKGARRRPQRPPQSLRTGAQGRVRLTRRALISALTIGVAAIALAACGSSSSSSSASSSGSGSSGTSSSVSATASGQSAAAANAILAPYADGPSAFPVTQKLAKRPVGDHIIYVSAGTPVSQQSYQAMIPAAKTLGVNMTEVNAGSSASTVGSAFDTVLSEHPAAIVVNAIDIDLWAAQLKKIQAAGTKVVSNGVFGLEKYGVPSPTLAEPFFTEVGKLDAAYVAANYGQKASIVFYTVPALQLTGYELTAFEAELAKLCPDCTTRVVQIDIATLGNTSATTIANDLEAHPTTKVAVFSADEMALGLTAAERAAGVSGVKTIGNLPTSSNFAQLQDGTETAAVGFDVPILGWMQLDQAAREIDGQALSGPEAKGFLDMQILTKSNLKNVTNGIWTGYPDFVTRFKTLWGVS